jgi:hypothetical protein
MRLNKGDFKEYISLKQKELKNHLTIRIMCLMDYLKQFEGHDDEQIELFEVLVRLTFLADETAAKSISNLMIPLDSEASYIMDEHTIQESASFLRDFLKKDAVLYAIKSSNSPTR